MDNEQWKTTSGTAYELGIALRQRDDGGQFETLQPLKPSSIG
jgi:hypothetical protein